MKVQDYFIFSILLLLLGGCSFDGKQNIEAYYYPLKDLQDGIVYEYRPVDNDTLPEEYWYFRSLFTDSMDYLTANYYDRNFVVRQFTTEEFIDEGALIKDYFLYDFDSTGLQTQIPAQVKFPTAFPFEVRDSGGIFLTHLKWTFQDDPEISTTLIKNRHYEGKSSFTFKGKEVDAVVFSLRERVEDTNNGNWEREYTGKEIYAKNIGLVYYEKMIDDNFTLKYQLVDTFSMKELESRFQSTIGFNDLAE